MNCNGKYHKMFYGGEWSGITSVSTYNLNSSTTMTGSIFYCCEDMLLSKVYIVIASKTGSPIAADIQISLLGINSATGLPDISDVKGTCTLDSDPVANGTAFVTATFSSPISLTKGNFYAYTVQNLNAAPTTNYIGLNYQTVTRISDTSNTKPCERRVFSTNSGSSWSASNYDTKYILEDTLNRMYGVGVISSATYSGSAGGTFTAPKTSLVMSMLQIYTSRVGTYTNETSIQIIDPDNQNVIATSTNAIPFSLFPTTPNWVAYYFDDVVLKPGKMYYWARHYSSGTPGGINFPTIVLYDVGTEQEILKRADQVGGLSVLGTPGAYYASTSENFVIPYLLGCNALDPVRLATLSSGYII